MSHEEAVFPKGEVEAITGPPLNNTTTSSTMPVADATAIIDHRLYQVPSAGERHTIEASTATSSLPSPDGDLAPSTMLKSPAATTTDASSPPPDHCSSQHASSQIPHCDSHNPAAPDVEAIVISSNKLSHEQTHAALVATEEEKKVQQVASDLDPRDSQDTGMHPFSRR